MTSARWVSGEELEVALPVRDAIDALDDAWRKGFPDAPKRSHIEVDAGDVLVMPAHSRHSVGVKLVGVAPGNAEKGLPLIGGIYVLFDTETLMPELLIDASALTALRTAAVTGVVTRHLANEDARSLVVFGSGVQAKGHIEAMRAVRPIDAVKVIGRTTGKAERLAAEVSAEVGVVEDVRYADIVCCCTTSHTPLFDGSLLRQGAHVNAIGSYKPDRRELDGATLGRAAAVVVEDVTLASMEAGDVILAMGEGHLVEGDLMTVADVVAGRVKRTASDLTVFKSVGMASEDLVVAAALRDRLGHQ
ncbi:MAG: ornithine cyclodeaminase family protein [Actinomycetota bacterium]